MGFLPCSSHSCRKLTVEVRSASLLVPTISLNKLAYLASLCEAPNGSIKYAELGRKFQTSSNATIVTIALDE
jgi:hypothetical protein